MAMASAMSKSTTSRITADFKHLVRTKGPSGVFKVHARKLNPLIAKPTDAHPEDRIKWWNIVPGDRVRIIRGPYKDSNRIVEVLSVNKYKNLVMFKDLSYPKKDPNTPAMPVKAHYSNLQLYMGKREYPPDTGGSPILKDVFATRIHMTEPRYNIKEGRWIWERYAAKTSPVLPELQGVAGGRCRSMLSEAKPISWPEIPRPRFPPATQYDTTRHAASAVTWKPMMPDTDSLTGTVQVPGSSATSVDVEETYIRALMSNDLSKLGSSLPMETYLHEELSNPHSRAKKQKRWQARRHTEAEGRTRMIREEMANLHGRKRAVARREAVFRWRAKLSREGKERTYQRWVQRGGLERVARRSRRKTKKEERRLRRLRSLVLQVGTKNQVVPGVETQPN